MQPYSNNRISPHHTKINPLPALDINEAPITGNAEVDEAVVDELELRKRVRHFWEHVCIIAGDQLSLARLRALENIRAGQEGGYEGFAWGVLDARSFPWKDG